MSATLAGSDVFYAPFTAPKTFKCLGIMIAIASIITFILGIVDVAVTYQVYMMANGCYYNTASVICQPGNLAYTWVGVGIWASVPIFITGVLAAYLTDHPNRTKKWFTMLSFVSAIIFAPVMVIISAVEAAMAKGVFYNNPPYYNDYEKLILPVLIAVLGFLEFVMTAILMIRMCFCTEDPIAKRSAMTIKTVTSTVTPAVVQTSTPTPVVVQAATPTVNPVIIQAPAPSVNPISYQTQNETVNPITVTMPVSNSASGSNVVTPYWNNWSNACNNCTTTTSGAAVSNTDNNNTTNNIATNWSTTNYEPYNFRWAKFPLEKSNFITLAGPSACSTNLPVAYSGAYNFYAK